MRFYELRKKYDTPAYFPAYRSTPLMDSYFQEKNPHVFVLSAGPRSISFSPYYVENRKM